MLAAYYYIPMSDRITCTQILRGLDSNARNCALLAIELGSVSVACDTMAPMVETVPRETDSTKIAREIRTLESKEKEAILHVAHSRVEMEASEAALEDDNLAMHEGE